MNEDSSLSKLDLRNIIVPVKNCSRIPWILKTPKSVREGSVFEAYKNQKACFTNLKNNNIKKFKMKFLSRKKESWTIYGINSVKKISNKLVEIFPDYNIGYMKLKEEIPDVFQTCSIHFDGKFYYLLVPVITDKKNINHRDLCVATDPGVRTFNTFYDGSEFYKVGDQANSVYYKDLIHLDKLISQKTKGKNRKQKKILNKHIIKIKRRLKNKQDELQWKTSNWICKKYNKILIPEFEAKKMTEKKNRKIKSKTVRQMGLISHFKFRQKLKTKAEEYKCKVELVSEAYTSKTCGNCNKRQNINGLHKWRCRNCNHYHDRDVNASRNILIWNYDKVIPEK